MRRSDREIADRGEIIQVMERCDVCRLAFHNGDYPYIVPLNFGMEADENQVTLYFHSAMTGKKVDLMEQDCRVGFEMDCGHVLVMEKEKGNCTMAYESVVGFGHLEPVPEEDKFRALSILMAHYHQEEFPFDQSVMPRTRVYKLIVEQMTGKRRKKP